MTPLRHVSLLRGGQLSTCLSSFAAKLIKLTQKAPRAEPKSLRSLQAEKESVWFRIPIAHLTYPSIFPSTQSVVRLLYIFVPLSTPTSILQVTGPLRAHSVLIVRRLAASVSSQSLSRCDSLSIPSFILIEHLVHIGPRPPETVNDSGLLSLPCP